MPTFCFIHAVFKLICLWGRKKEEERKESARELAKYKNRTKLELISQISLKNEGEEHWSKNLGSNSISFTPLPCFEVVIFHFFWKMNSDSKICPLHIYNRKWTPWLLLSLVLLKGLIIVTAEEVTLTSRSHSWRTDSWQKKSITLQTEGKEQNDSYPFGNYLKICIKKSISLHETQLIQLNNSS